MRSQYILAKPINHNISLHNYYKNMEANIWRRASGFGRSCLLEMGLSECVYRPGKREAVHNLLGEREFRMGKLITDTILSWIVIAIECVGPYQMISCFPNGNKTFYIHTFVNEDNYLLIKDVHLAHIRWKKTHLLSGYHGKSFQLWHYWSLKNAF